MRWRSLLVGLFCLSSTAHAYDNFPARITACCHDNLEVAVKFGLFYPASSIARQIYSSVWPNYEVEANWLVAPNIMLWSSVNLLTKSGDSIGGHQGTRIYIVPISFGPKFCYDCGYAKFYGGYGLSLFSLNVYDHSDYVKRHLQNTSFGGVFKAGALLRYNERQILDLSLEYFIKSHYFNPENVTITTYREQIGGLGILLGVGWLF